jgi:hypothetical protein
VGIFPWFAFHLSRYGYSPWYAYYGFEHGPRDRNWEGRMRDWYRHVRDNHEARPPRTFREQATLTQHARTEAEVQDRIVAKPLTQVTADRDAETPIRFERLNQGRRQELQRQATEVRRTESERVKTEVQARGAAESAREKKPIRLKLPKSPLSGPQERTTVRTQAPPARPQDPKPDLDAKSGASRPSRPPRPEDRIEVQPRRDDSGRPGAEPPKPPTRPPTGPPSKAEPPRRGDVRPPTKPPSKPPSKPPGKKDGTDR